MKKFFERVGVFLHILFGFNLDTWITEHVQPAIDTVERIKDFISNPVVDFLAKIIPGAQGIDDALKAYLVKAIDLLNVAGHINAQGDDKAKISMFLQWLSEQSDAMRSAVYRQLAAEIAKASAGVSSIKNYSIDLLTQLQYSKMKSGVNTDEIPDEVPIAKPVVDEPAAPAATE